MRGTAMAELDAMTPRFSQWLPGEEIPEQHWMYRWRRNIGSTILGRIERQIMKYTENNTRWRRLSRGQWSSRTRRGSEAISTQRRPSH